MTDFETTMAAVLQACTTMYRKGEVIAVQDRFGIKRVDVYAMPHVQEAPPDEMRVDVHFCVVGVNMRRARQHAGGFTALLAAYPTEAWGYPTQSLQDGPSYISVGAVVGSQDNALRMFAMGEALGMWKVLTPEVLGITGEEADVFAGRGLVMMSGWRLGQSVS